MNTAAIIGTVIAGLIVLTVIVALLANMAELRRYLRIRNM